MISKEVTAIFKLAYNQISRHGRKSRQCSGVNSFWVINNNQPVLESLEKISKTNKAKTISSFDFSTLYTNIPHDKLFDELCKVIDFIFKGGDRKFISVTKHGGANWVKIGKGAKSLYDKEKIVRAVKYLLDNCYFNFGTKVFRQVIGIPMGSDPAPYFANLFLYQYESRWMRKMKKENHILARKFGNIFRYIDDLVAINDSREFEKHFKKIYPPELVLKKENLDNRESTFLDLKIIIENGVFNYSVYDKRDNFGFWINRLPFKRSNTPASIFYNCINAEILRICRASSKMEYALKTSKDLIQRMLRQGQRAKSSNKLRADLNTIYTGILRCFNRHKTVIAKYGKTPNQFLELLKSF